MNRLASVAAVVLVVALALTALYRLLALEYDYGEGYPEYSSLRADPLGALVLFDALSRARDTAPRRSVEPLGHAKFVPDTTLLMAGAGISKDDVSTLERVEHYVREGGRCVILFRADQDYGARALADEQRGKRDKANDRKEKSSDKTGPDEEESAEDEMLEALMPRADISERWGFGYSTQDFSNDETKDNTTWVERAKTAPETLPERLPWHSTVTFTDLAAEWTPLYTRDGYAVVMEREWGQGRIVLATDSYLVSNEAMRSDRRAEFLAWLLPSDRPVIFEETHLGVSIDSGVMTLARRYGLMPMLGAAVIVTLLFIWRNAAPLVPKRRATRDDAAVVAGTTVSGLASLAQRAIRTGDLLETCWKLFETPVMRRPPMDDARRKRVEAELAQYRAAPRRRRNPAEAYNQIAAIIQERKTP